MLTRVIKSKQKSKPLTQYLRKKFASNLFKKSEKLEYIPAEIMNKIIKDVEKYPEFVLTVNIARITKL